MATKMERQLSSMVAEAGAVAEDGVDVVEVTGMAIDMAITDHKLLHNHLPTQKQDQLLTQPRTSLRLKENVLDPRKTQLTHLLPVLKVVGHGAVHGVVVVAAVPVVDAADSSADHSTSATSQSTSKET